ncbi:MAG: MotA/TolQ/ExbB proton channel family protein, partial [Bacteroidaceae bacterium]|nr:MotA/TolQ/ExbB proton channel family protein [Bacteroidaceae bacterium]
MKKLFAIVAMLGMFTFGTTQVYAQDAAEAAPVETVENTDQAAAPAEEAAAPAAEEVAAPAEEAAAPAEVTEASESEGVHKTLKTKFIEGGAEFMALVAIAMVIGLAFCVERIIYLSMAKVNTKNLMEA